jgi:CheY-like chemotaxis protein
MQHAIDTHRPAIEAAGLELSVDWPDPAAVVDVDPVRFVQILSNVLHNASKFTPAPGRIRVSAELQRDNGSPNRRAVITVSDTGIGISREMLPRVFELFTQAGRPTQRTHTGLGIGLALARRLIELHGGGITADSDGPDRGSTFAVTVPLSEASPATHAARHADVRRIRSRVVIIDDNRDAARSMSMLVDELGGSARTAYDAASGLDAVREFRPDVVFLDIGMPGMDGYEACRRIRQAPSDRHVVVVAVTGWGQPQDKQRALDAGFDAHLTKPVDPATFTQILATSAAN